jgi:hypothetical protein
MVGLCSLFFLFSGLWLLYPDPLPQSYFSEKNWSAAQSILRHIKPATEVFESTLPEKVSTCRVGKPGFIELKKTVDKFDKEILSLKDIQFLVQSYRLDFNGLLLDPMYFAQGCDDLLQPIQWLLNRTSDSRITFLQSLIWRERLQTAHVDRLLGNEWVAIPQSLLSMRSPWSGISGCIFGTDTASGKIIFAGSPENSLTRFCLDQLPKNNNLDLQVFSEPINLPSMATMIQGMNPWRIPQHSNHNLVTSERHVALIRGSLQPVGHHIQLSIDPDIQNKLQQLLYCYTNNEKKTCLSISTKGDNRFEGARVRMAGLALLDVPSGRIIAAASSNSPCYLHDLTRTGKRPKDCPDVPEGTVHRPQFPQAPDNHALFKQAPPGSLVKPLLMSGILAGNGKYVGLEAALQRSDSNQFLDAWLCRKELGRGTFATDCGRPARTQQIAHALGWNHGCLASDPGYSKLQCGEIDLLWGMPLTQADSANTDRSSIPVERPILSVLNGHTLVKPIGKIRGRSGYQDIPWPDSLPTVSERNECARAGQKGYVGCGGNRLDIVSEAYGQGNTLTTPIGISGLLAALANSAAGQKNRLPHLMVNVFRNDNQSVDLMLSLKDKDAKYWTQGIDPYIANRVISAMKLTHRPGGTANAACNEVWGVKDCKEDLGIAGKTGTPGNADDRSLFQLKQDMNSYNQCLKEKNNDCAYRFPLPRPRYRWYAALYKSPGSDFYDKVLAVLVHSNWRRSDGRYVDDQNAAAEIGMHAIFQLRKHNKTHETN